MPFYAHERFQVFCRFCQGKMGGRSGEEGGDTRG